MEEEEGNYEIHQRHEKGEPAEHTECTEIGYGLIGD